ncbi:oligopeptide/dipeptide ABC transporter ATP-binding protein [Candidatus Formimonas warabiya]|uniref:ABC transporter domain-containing protein n=1 Tax=Formimonas warabiya TaxID=1761012 RepID=A0A3G1KYN9_FORW1|nr:oligopeptide/dipeptide ABC transporter ATP-binding protein [Candidatus Formimonas warabiya]ATW27604.1 hypothetical protein DCMF_25165 [Candidatus Formimonas warabiya]
MDPSTRPPLYRVKKIKKYYGTGPSLFHPHARILRAVDEVDLAIYPHETVGLVGESGCGKSTLARLMMHLEPVSGGTMEYLGRDITRITDRDLFLFRRQVQMIFQDAWASLNPRQRIGDMIREPLENYRLTGKKLLSARVEELLELVGLEKAHLSRYPHELSGGERQRVTIARALAVEPRILICDEATANLDVSIQAQMVNLLITLQQRLGLSYLFISHDLALVKHLSDRIAVMYLGKIVEMLDSSALVERARHPYTQSLLAAVLPIAGEEPLRSLPVLKGEAFYDAAAAQGCGFCPRCSQAGDLCWKMTPRLWEMEAGHFVACHLIQA